MKTEKAVLAAGCFWGVESELAKLPGVVSTTVGYTGGTFPNPTYEDVCTDKTGHAEAVEVLFDPEKISYEKLLEHFWEIHDPTTINRQGPDVGTQYRSAVFFSNAEQEKTAKQLKEKLNHSKKFKKPIVTEIAPSKEFYPAEEYHQKYYLKHTNLHCGI
jgi:methionine-S-sulfoxide reductase